jgi:Truncated hemoglobins
MRRWAARTRWPGWWTSFTAGCTATRCLAPIFPQDLTETRRKQFAFLSQFFGGPPLFSEHYGPPRLRYRHLPFPITPARARAWLSVMDAAMDAAGIDPAVKPKLMERLTRTAAHMVNTDEDGAPVP